MAPRSCKIFAVRDLPRLSRLVSPTGRMSDIDRQIYPSNSYLSQFAGVKTNLRLLNLIRISPGSGWTRLRELWHPEPDPSKLAWSAGKFEWGSGFL